MQLKPVICSQAINRNNKTNVTITALSRRLKKVVSLVKHPHEKSKKNNFPLIIPLLPFIINWLQTEFLVLSPALTSLIRKPGTSEANKKLATILYDLHTQFSFSFIAIITSDFPDCLTNPNPNPKQVNICHLKPIFLENNCEFLCPKLKKTSYFYIKRVDGHIK